MEPLSCDSRCKPSINIINVADRFLLADKAMAAVRHIHEIQNVGVHGTSPKGSSPEIPKWHTFGMNGTHHSSCNSNGIVFSQVQSQDNDNKDFLFAQAMCGSLGNESLPLNQPKPERPKQRSTRPPLLPPCRVCGDRASGLHYGVNTCEACKGFFRRSINKSADAYTCIGSGRCKLVPGKRTACSSCRYQRCLEVGMSKSAIKTGRYTHELRSKNIMEVKSLQRKNDLDGSPVSDCEIVDITIDNEEPQFNVDSAENKEYESILKFLLEGQSCLNEFLDEYYDEELMRSRQFAVYYRYMANKPGEMKNNFGPKQEEGTNHDRLGPEFNEYICGSKCDNSLFDNSKLPMNGLSNRAALNGFQNHSSNQSGYPETSSHHIQNGNNSQNSSWSHLPNQISSTSGQTTDCDTNIKESQESVNQSGQTNGIVNQSTQSSIGEEKKKGEVLSAVLKDVERSVHGLLTFSKCVPGFQNLLKEDQAALLKASRFDIWYIGHIRCFNTELRVGACEWQFHAEELEKVWGKTVVDLAFCLSKRGQKLDLSKEETVALRAVCLSFSDRCYPLEERARIEAIHEHMWDLLKYVGRKRHKNYNIWFTKVVDFLVILREFGINFENASSCLKLDWSVLNENPFLLEVFLS